MTRSMVAIPFIKPDYITDVSPRSGANNAAYNEDKTPIV
jgi:hypothetical protein